MVRLAGSSARKEKDGESPDPFLAATCLSGNTEVDLLFAAEVSRRSMSIVAVADSVNKPDPRYFPGISLLSWEI